MSKVSKVNKIGFEVKTCGRCGGRGHYSRNAMGSTTCYSCNGAKEIYTKRGATARARFVELTSVKASEIVVGDRIHMQDGCWRNVTEIAFRENAGKVNGVPYSQLTINTKKVSYGVGPDTLVRVWRGQEAWDACLASALAFQATL